MRSDLTITEIHKVSEGNFVPGKIKKNSRGRYSDCFVCFFEGYAEYVFDDHSFVAQAPCFFYLARGSFYSIDIRENCKYIYADFDFDADTEQKSCIFKNASRDITKAFTKLFFAWNKNSLYRRPQALSLVYDMYSEAIRSADREYSRYGRVFSEITSYIIEHCTDPALSVSSIAAHAEISEVHLRRIFKTCTGLSPIKYINRLRLQKAKDLLSSSNCSISDIALSVGFSDRYYFSVFFKKELGISPSEYRKENFDL